MPNRIAIAVLLPLLVLSCGKQADTPEAIVNDMVSVINEIPPISATVTNEATVEAAMDKFNALEERMDAITARAKKIKAPPKPQLDLLDARIKAAWAVVTADLKPRIAALKADKKTTLFLGLSIFDLRNRSTLTWLDSPPPAQY